MLTEISKITINKLILNAEQKEHSLNNIEQLINTITLKLANDYPQQYPQVSAKLYAKNHPNLDATEYAKKNPQAGPIVEHTEDKKTRGKPETKLKISAIYIKNLEINTIQSGSTKTIQKSNIHITAIGEKEGLFLNQIGGEILLHLLNTK